MALALARGGGRDPLNRTERATAGRSLRNQLQRSNLLQVLISLVELPAWPSQVCAWCQCVRIRALAPLSCCPPELAVEATAAQQIRLRPSAVEAEGRPRRMLARACFRQPLGSSSGHRHRPVPAVPAGRGSVPTQPIRRNRPRLQQRSGAPATGTRRHAATTVPGCGRTRRSGHWCRPAPGCWHPS